LAENFVITFRTLAVLYSECEKALVALVLTPFSRTGVIYENVSSFESKEESISMLYKSCFISRCALVALAFPMLGLPAAITVNAPGVSLCSTAGCAVDSLNLPPGQSTSGTYNTAFTTGGDAYKLSVSYANSISAATGSISYFFDPILTYVGTTPTAQADTIKIDMLQNFASGPAPIYWDSPPDYTEDVPFSIPANASATAQACFTASSTPTTECLALLTATTSGLQSSHSPLGTGTPGFPYLDGLTLAEDFDITYTFAKGTPTGASASSPSTSAVPEPSQCIPAGIGLASLLFLKARRLRSKDVK
jgi:hypothetical protein